MPFWGVDGQSVDPGNFDVKALAATSDDDLGLDIEGDRDPENTPCDIEPHASCST